jgi:hypothetical protein
VEAVRPIVRAERDRTVAEGAKADVVPGTSFFILRDLEGCWDCPALKEGVFQELKAADNSPEQFAALLDALLAASFDPARDYAIGLFAEHDVPAGPYALVAAEVLARRCAAHIWPALWKSIVSDDTFARKLLLRLASHYRSDTPFYAGVGEFELAELFILMERLFPRDEDPIHEAGEAHWVGPRESLGDIRDGVPKVSCRSGYACRHTGLAPGHCDATQTRLVAVRAEYGRAGNADQDLVAFDTERSVLVNRQTECAAGDIT